MEKFIFHQTGADELTKIWHQGEGHVTFLYVHSGDGNVVTHEKLFPIEKGSLFFIGAKKYHYTLPNTPSLYDRSKLFVPTAFFENICFLCDESTRLQKLFSDEKLVCARLSPAEESVIGQLFSSLQKNENSECFNSLFISVCTRLLFYFNEYPSDETTSYESKNFVFNAVKYINEHVSEPITIDELCANSFISKYYFCRQFKKLTGFPVMEYVLRTRLSLAQKLLTSSNQTIAFISEQCGFSSVSYFCTSFKKYYCVTPLAYRKKVAKTISP